MAAPFTINARTAVAATATSTSTSRVYFQDTQNGIREVVYDNENWNVSNDVLFSAKRSTPLAVVSWDEGRQVIPLSTVFRGNIDKGSDSGSNLAALSFKDGGKVHLRVYYQAPDLSLREHCNDGNWNEGHFNPGVAIKSSAIAATSWIATGTGVQLRLFWQDNHGLLRGYRWSRGWESTGSLNLMPVGTHISAINWDTGNSVRVYYQANDGTITEEVTHSLRTTILQL
ncbi:uncharacterized protein Triagg1_2761 [Trichoderma aggressivum f. europaeum]|uniref:Fucose-specific lectin n=1 Tax=Trichoderma aggressivum f. europaeum TaxID=173218 RepID=A0AAE1IKD2_9HYPO|nr:hypothetical protein Triagg1_2761 [Trichoderma aggressivum f. europaeum]